MNRIVRCLLPLHIPQYQYKPIRIVQVLYGNSEKEAFHSSVPVTHTVGIVDVFVQLQMEKNW